MRIRMKASHHGFILAALIPCPKFLTKDKAERGVLMNRLVHHCLDIICRPLKIVARSGREMSDPCGNLRYCYTPLAAYIADTPEAALLTGVGGKTLHLTMASYKEFGDDYQHTPRSRSTTLAQLHAVQSKTEPWDLRSYIAAVKTYRLNGVYLPFWRDWDCGSSPTLSADPYRFLMPKPLHHWHKQFWDHDVKWAIRVLSSSEIDFRFSVLQPHVGFRQFKEGISALKQVTGREHRDVQHILIAVIAGAAPPRFIIALRSLMEFRYLGQATTMNSNFIDSLSSSLANFHSNKVAILDAGARVGKGKKRMDHFQIPKLKFLQSIVPSILWAAVPIQWSADITEHAHITEIKIPARSGNNKQYGAQICRFLDRAEKRRNFDLATSIQEADFDFDLTSPTPDEGYESDDDELPPLLSIIDPNELFTPSRTITNLFTAAELLQSNSFNTALLPLRTFCSSVTVFHLNREPNIRRAAIDEIAQKFCLPDLRPAIADYLKMLSLGHGYQESRPLIGGRRSAQ
jgi:hypothetical protein